jgi:hypothetical protein
MPPSMNGSRARASYDRSVRAIFVPLLLLAGCAGLLGQYTAERTGPPPAEAAPGIAGEMQPTGFRIRNHGSPYCEIWLRATQPPSNGTEEPGITLSSIPAGALLGMIRFDSAATDRRGQRIAPGLYTLRYAIMPRNESHEGVSRQRDFVVLVPAADDQSPSTRPTADALAKMSGKVSGTGHPAVLSIRKAAADSPGFSEEGQGWVLQTEVGNTPIQIVLASSLEP